VTTGPRHRLLTGPADVTGYDCLVTDRAGDGVMPELNDPLADRPAADPPRRPESDRVHAELQERMERLPPGHPSSPYNDDGTRKPPPLDLSDYELPIPGDPDYQPESLGIPETSHSHDTSGDDVQDHESPAADAEPEQELPPDQDQIGDVDAREQQEHRLSQIADQMVERCREAEGRDADGNYGEEGLTPAMRRIESQLDHGHLAENTEEYALKGPERFREKIAERAKQFPNTDPRDLAAEIHDGIRYTFIFEFEHYTAGVDLAQSRLAEAGFGHIETKPGWHRDEYKGVNSQWSDPASGLRFEVQLHTNESWSAKQTTHWAYEKIRSTSTSVEETESLRSYQREVSVTVQIPPGALDIPAYKKESR
jgi:hypothetical protein